MMRAMVYGPSTSGSFGCDAHLIASEDDLVVDAEGTLTVTVVPAAPEGRPVPSSIKVRYPAGGWTKLIVKEYADV